MTCQQLPEPIPPSTCLEWRPSGNVRFIREIAGRRICQLNPPGIPPLSGMAFSQPRKAPRHSTRCHLGSPGKPSGVDFPGPESLTAEVSRELRKAGRVAQGLHCHQVLIRGISVQERMLVEGKCLVSAQPPGKGGAVPRKNQSSSDGGRGLGKSRRQRSGPKSAPP